MELWTTTALAFYGAAVSTGLLCWKIFLWWNDRGRLKVTCYIGTIVEGGVADPVDRVVWGVVNTGRQPITLSQGGGRFRRGQRDGAANFILKQIRYVPKTLKPTETDSWHSNNCVLLGSDIRDLGVWNTAGRYYKAPRKQVVKLKQDYADEQNQTRCTL